MADTKQMWRGTRTLDRFAAAAYDFGVEREPVARAGGYLLWGTDARLLFRDIRRLAELPAGSAVLDLPCGGGVALRGRRAGGDVRYVAADLSPFMLERARGVATRAGLSQIEFREADVESLPFSDDEFDLVLSYSGLHCFPDPALALRELRRCLKPGGVIRGDCAVRGEKARADLLIGLYQRVGIFGPGGTASDVDRWLEAAGLITLASELRGAVLFFEAQRAS